VAHHFNRLVRRNALDDERHVPLIHADIFQDPVVYEWESMRDIYDSAPADERGLAKQRYVLPSDSDPS